MCGCHTECAWVRSVRVPLTVVPIGRVCGTGMGIACTQVTRRDVEDLDELQDRGGERVPREVGLVSGQQHERVSEGVVREGQLEPRRPIVGEVILLERDDRPASTVVQEHVIREHRERCGVELIAQVVDELAHRTARIGEAGQRDDQRQSARHGRRRRRACVQRTGEGHASMLRVVSR